MNDLSCAVVPAIFQTQKFSENTINLVIEKEKKRQSLLKSFANSAVVLLPIENSNKFLEILCYCFVHL